VDVRSLLLTSFEDWTLLAFQGGEEFKQAVKKMFWFWNSVATIGLGLSGTVRIGPWITMPISLGDMGPLRDIAQHIEVDVNGLIRKVIKQVHRKVKSTERWFSDVQSVRREHFENLDSQIVVIEAQVASTDLMSATVSPLTAKDLSKSEFTWTLSDNSPGETPLIPKFHTEEFILLENKDEFPRHFGGHVPFCADVGWYPHVRITGVFKKPPPGEKYPRVSVGYVELKPPKPYDVLAESMDSVFKSRPDVWRFGDMASEKNRTDFDEQRLAFLIPILLGWWTKLDPSDFQYNRERCQNACAWYKGFTSRHGLHADVVEVLDKFYEKICAT
jgi:BMFP domain-containing protein YqiC